MFVHGNVRIKLYRVLLFPYDQLEPLHESLPPRDKMENGDPTGSWCLKAYALVTDGNNQHYRNLGLEELENFRIDMAGIVNLKIPERLSMDTRVK